MSRIAKFSAALVTAAFIAQSAALAQAHARSGDASARIVYTAS